MRNHNKRKRAVGGVASIQPGEHVVVRMRPAWRYYLKFVIIPLAVIPMFGFQADFFLCCFSFMAIMILYSRYSNSYYVTTHRVIQRTGFIAKNTSQSCLQDIQLIETSQGIFDRLLGVGTVKMESAAQSSRAGDVVFGGIANPVEGKEKIFRLKYKAERRRRKSSFPRARRR